MAVDGEASGHARFEEILQRQKAAFLRDGAPSAAKRRAGLLKLRKAILDWRDGIERAVDADFRHRPSRETAIMEILPTLQGIDYLRANLSRWMRPRRRSVAIQLRPGSAKIIVQPLGVIGIMAPWNYPISLCLMPLATAIAAGNRAMIKPSELAPRTAELIGEMIGQIFPAEETAVVTGGPEAGAAFAALPFDHLIFTGSTKIGRAVMRAASEHLVPVTLELGGKSPVIVDRGFSLKRAAKAIAYGKLANAGQTCIAPDYAFVHESETGAFADAYKHAARAAYPAGAADEAYCGIITQGHCERLASLVSDAKAKGGEIVEIFPAAAHREQTVPPILILNAAPGMRVMEEEIFGPILPVLSYRGIDDAIARINDGPRPLALYVMSTSRSTVSRVLENTVSGNVTVNDTLLHYAVDDLPFGGIGPSGMGAYHGEEGFRSLSHDKGVFTQTRFNFASILRAPFGRLSDLILDTMLR